RHRDAGGAARSRAARPLSRLGRRRAHHRQRGAGAALRRRRPGHRHRRPHRSAARALSRHGSRVARPERARGWGPSRRAPARRHGAHTAGAGGRGMSDPIIRTAGLTKRFGDFTAVDGLSIAVEPGSIFAFLGGNGSGKSTTIRMLIGLLRPTAGSIEVDGIDVIKRPRRVRDHIGYMGQKVSLYQGLSLRENVEFYAGLFGLAGDGLARRWGELRDRFALADAEDERPENLPAAIRQRAGLAL